MIESTLWHVFLFTFSLVVSWRWGQSVFGSDRSSRSWKRSQVYIDEMSIRTCVQVFSSVCHSGIEFMRALRRAQTEKLVEVQCEDGAQGKKKGVATGLPVGSQFPELAQHVDTEPMPDLRLHLQPKGKRWRDSRIRATSASWFIFPFFSDHPDWLLFSLSRSLWLRDIWFSFSFGRLASTLLPFGARSGKESVTQYYEPS